MSTEGTLDLPIEVLGGLVTNVAPSDLPHGVSPDCQDLAFQIGSAKTRPGVTLNYMLAGNPTVNSLATYETLTEIPRFVSLDSLGVLRKDVAPGGALTPIYSGIIPGNTFFKSCSLFGRQYFGFSNGLNGLDLPRQYDDTNFDRISQVGPGQAPTAMDENVTANLVASPNGALQGAAFTLNNPFQTETGYTVTVQINTVGSAMQGVTPRVGDFIQIAGSVPGYNGTWPIISAAQLGGAGDALQVQFISNIQGLGPTVAGTISFAYAEFVLASALTFVPGQLVLISGTVGFNGTFPVVTVIDNQHYVAYIGIFATANSGGGTIAAGGSISAGKHQISVIFVTRSSAYFVCRVPNSWQAGGSKRAIVSNIPIGPPNVIARVLCFTAAGGSSFYHLGPTGLTIYSSNMYIADNTTTQLTVDFSDAVLLLGTLDDPLFNQIELPPVAGTIDYSDRLFAWGEQANLQAFLNLTFDGGFSNLTSYNTGVGANLPLGWTPDPVNSGGGGSALVGGKTAVFGDAYTITGDGATAVRGKITQSAAADSLGNPILSPNTAYTVQARIAVIGLAVGNLHINLQSTLGGFTTPGMIVPFNLGGLSAKYIIVSASLTNGLATIPSDLMLQLYADGTPTAGGIFLVDNIEIYPTNAQYNNSNVRASFGQLNTQGQESFDSETGLIQWNLNDGQSVRTLFKIRERLYIVKEHSFGVTADDGVDEPDQWTVDDVSKKVGTPSINGVGIGEDWVVIAHRTGLYIFWGGEVLKISEEIQQLWDTINWQYGQNIAVTVDTRRRRILICAPFGANQVQPNKTLVLDYHDVGSDASAIASNPPIHLTYTGAKRAFDRARKWCPWTIPANCVAQIEQANGQTLIYFGSNDLTGNINVLDDTNTVFTDNGAQIPSYYTTSFLPDRETKQGLQLSQHRIAFQYLTTYSQGVGSIGVTVFLDTLSNAIALNPQSLSNPALKDIEMGINQLTERMAVKFSNSGAGNWFDLQNMVLNAKTDPWAPVRGSN